MEDTDVNPFGEHEYRPDEPIGENIPLTPAEGGSSWEPELERETSFRGRPKCEHKMLLRGKDRITKKN